MPQLPEDAPESPGAAFARINAVASPSLDDLKTMVFLEASGQVSYGELAKAAPNAGIRALLEANGREEMAHAHRVAKVIKLLSGEDFGVPAAEDNRYAARPTGAKVDRAMLEMLVQAEDNGATLYETWAAHTADAEAAALLRQNAKEEARHGNRAKEALALLGD
jgi:rubrerythrin